MRRFAAAAPPRFAVPKPRASRRAGVIDQSSGTPIRRVYACQRCERRHRDSDHRPDEGLRRGPRALRPRPRCPAGRDPRLSRAQRRRQVDDHAAPARPDQADLGVGDAPWARQPGRQPRGAASRRLPARRPRPLSDADRVGDARLPRRAPRRRRPAGARRARRAIRRRARPAAARALDGEPPEARPHPGVHARARAPDPRRADRGPRSARPAELPRAPRGGRRAGTHRLPLVAHAVRGRAGRGPGRDPAPWPARGRRLARAPARDRRPAPRDRVRGRRSRPSTSSGPSPACARPPSRGGISSWRSRARPMRSSR